LRELRQVGATDNGILMFALKMRIVPGADPLELGGPAGACALKFLKRVDQ